MCGIFGCLLSEGCDEDLVKMLILALNLLKNRGYDSVGIFLKSNEGTEYLKKIGIDGEIIKSSDKKDIIKILVKNNIPIRKTSEAIKKWSSLRGGPWNKGLTKEKGYEENVEECWFISIK